MVLVVVVVVVVEGGALGIELNWELSASSSPSISITTDMRETTGVALSMLLSNFAMLDRNSEWSS